MVVVLWFRLRTIQRLSRQSFVVVVGVGVRCSEGGSLLLSIRKFYVVSNALH